MSWFTESWSFWLMITRKSQSIRLLISDIMMESPCLVSKSKHIWAKCNLDPHYIGNSFKCLQLCVDSTHAIIISITMSLQTYQFLTVSILWPKQINLSLFIWRRLSKWDCSIVCENQNVPVLREAFEINTRKAVETIDTFKIKRKG